MTRQDGKERAEKIFLAAYVIWLAGAMISVTMWRDYEMISALGGYMRRAAYFLLLFEFLQRENYTKKDVAGIFVIVFVSIVAKHSVHANFAISAAFFVYFSAQARFRNILKYTLAFQAAFMVLTVAASQVGILEDVVWYEGARVRHSLGYDYCGYPAHLLLFMTMMWFCIRKKAHMADAALLLVLNYGMYRLTDSRTDFYLSVLGIAGAFVWPRDYRTRLIRVPRDLILKYGACAAAAGSIAAQYFYDPSNQPLSRLNYALNNRLQYGLDAIQKYGFSLFGKEIRWVGQGSLRAHPEKIYNYVDCAFLKDGLSLGLLFLALLLFGFWVAGKKLAVQNRYMESWAVLISLAYAVVNAHLCVLYFNVFILILGADFENEGAVEPRRALFGKAAGACRLAQANVGEFAAALGRTVPVKISGEKARRAARTILFLLTFIYTICVQCRRDSYMIKTAGMHMWVISGILLLLSAFCQEGNGSPKCEGTVVSRLLLVFLLLAGLSDLILNKRFRNAAIMLLVFGGLFCRSWRNMKRPQQLLEEFRWACAAGFVLSLVYCVICRPAFGGLKYSGMLPDAEMYGTVMILPFTVFLSGVRRVPPVGREKNGVVGLAPLFQIANGVGAALSLYLLWLTQEVPVLAAAALVLAVYAVFWTHGWILDGGKEKIRGIFEAAAILAVGFAAVLLLRCVIYTAAPTLGTQIVYANDEKERIQMQLPAALGDYEPAYFFTGKLQVCREYLGNLNVTGHYNRIKYKKKTVWAPNSLVMNLYRYGLPAGILYAVLLPVYLCRAFLDTRRRKDFLPLGLSVSSVAVGAVAAVERPFAHISWLVFYFGLAWLIVNAKTDKTP